MIFPIGSKRNIRKRGPYESIKQDLCFAEINANIKILYDTLNGFETETETVYSSLDSQDRDSMKEDISWIKWGIKTLST